LGEARSLRAITAMSPNSPASILVSSQSTGTSLMNWKGRMLAS
jgi:hypothetical protein